MKSRRQIFRSSAVIGSSSAINILIGILKVKVVAVFFGAAGIGLLGMYQNILAISTTIAGGGVNLSGVRQIATSSEDPALLSTIRRALWLASLLLGLIGMSIIWLLRESISSVVFGSTLYANDVGWLGLGVLFNLIANSQIALLLGLRRISDMAWVTVQGSVIGATAGILVVWLLGQNGVVWFVLVAPATSVIVAMRYVTKIPSQQATWDWHSIGVQWRALLTLGVPLMAAGLLALVTQLCARSFIQHELGLEASGHFQAAWAISISYISFALGAMAADYYPRLSAEIQNRARANELVNEQTEITLLLAGPILLVMLTLSPWVIQLLYSQNFTPASDMLRWQIMGDIIKIMCWPMGFIIMAMGRGGLFVTVQAAWNLIYLLTLWIGLDRIGIQAAGVSYLIAYVIQIVVIWAIAVHLIDFEAIKGNIRIFMLFVVAGGIVLLSTIFYSHLTYMIGLPISLILGIYSLYRINQMIDLLDALRKRFF